jgi:hypothetical protein
LIESELALSSVDVDIHATNSMSSKSVASFSRAANTKVFHDCTCCLECNAHACSIFPTLAQDGSRACKLSAECTHFEDNIYMLLEGTFGLSLDRILGLVKHPGPQRKDSMINYDGWTDKQKTAYLAKAWRVLLHMRSTYWSTSFVGEVNDFERLDSLVGDMDRDIKDFRMDMDNDRLIFVPLEI